MSINLGSPKGIQGQAYKELVHEWADAASKVLSARLARFGLDQACTARVVQRMGCLLYTSPSPRD
eukprot:10561739-Alexandrium_andersonii.AAC.1